MLIEIRIGFSPHHSAWTAPWRLASNRRMNLECRRVFDKLPELAEDVRVPPALLNLFLHHLKRFSGGHCPFIGPCGRQSVIDINRLQYPRGEWNLLCPQVVRIARTIKSLVVMPDDWQHQPK